MSVAPDSAPLVVSVGDLAARLGIESPTPAQQRTLTAAITDAQADVEAYLGQPITPRVRVQTGCWPYEDGWRLDEPPIAVVSAVAETYPGGTATGLFTVTYTAGLDAAVEADLAPIRRYVTWAALNAPAVVTDWQARQGDAARRLSNVSSDGQSASWQYLTPTGDADAASSGGAGAGPRPPALADLDRWRRAGRRVFQRRTRPPVPFGYAGPLGGWW